MDDGDEEGWPNRMKWRLFCDSWDYWRNAVVRGHRRRMRQYAALSTQALTATATASRKRAGRRRNDN
jgi:hypothetical protein